MLKVVNYNRDEYRFPSLIVLGCFDAIHAGHSELLKKAKLQAEIDGLDLGIMTFAEGKGGRQIYTFEERLAILGKYNVKFVLKIDYTDDFKKTSAIDFLKNIEGKINLKALMSGKDFRFGAGAQGNSSTLENYAEQNGVRYTAVQDVTYNDQKISTTFIKCLLEQGDIKTANALLTRNFAVSGTVVGGAERGARLGFRTMNINYPEDKVEVKHGVYAVKCEIDGKGYNGIANYGSRPTFEEDAPVLEVHLDGFQGEIYGQTVTVEFTDYLRDIQKFESAEALIAQLLKDIQKIRQ